MKLIFAHENRFIVNNIKNIIENAGIKTLFKNEYIAGAAGDLSPLDTWLELWVDEDSEYDKAIQLIKEINTADNTSNWECSYCHEKNPTSFEICWQCQRPGPQLKDC